MLMSTDYFVYLMMLPTTVIIILPLCLFVGWMIVSSIQRFASGPDHTDDYLQSVEG